MKTILSLLTFIVLSASAFAQSNLKAVTTYDTLSATVVQYADGDMVRGATANKIILVTAVPMPGKQPTGYITGVELCMDSVSANASFEIMALKDSTGTGALLTADNSPAQFRAAMKSNYIGSVNVSLTSLGTAAGGATASYGGAQWFHPYQLPTGKTKIYWVIFARGAYTPKQSGVVQLTVYMEPA